uniref:F-box domain-containing protein n=1 Tax=Mycena chlorophos TaxID=658473 RepID=A0ABQ0LN73_MYCCL|nr:predicted protein [Mycena chlorophos]
MEEVRPDAAAPAADQKLPLIQQFPFELLVEIFRYTDRLARETIVCAMVCRQWRAAAFSDVHLWTMLRISEYDFFELGRHALLQELLARSGDMPLWLGLRLRGPNTREFYDSLEEFLFEVIKPVLWRVARFTIIAPQNCWPVVIGMAEGERFPELEVLHLRSDAVKTMYKLDDMRLAPLWELPGDTPYPLVDDLPGVSPLDLVFPLPPGHPIRFINTQGVSVSNGPFPQLILLAVSHHLPQVLVKNEVNPWIYRTQALQLQGMYVPTVGATPELPFDLGYDRRQHEWYNADDWDIRLEDLQPDPYYDHGYLEDIDEEEEEEEAYDLEPEEPPPKCVMEALDLTQITAEPITTLPLEMFAPGTDFGDLTEHDCEPFFRDLVENIQESLKTLNIRRWNPDSRVWKDFIRVLTPQTVAGSLAATTAALQALAPGFSFGASTELAALVEFPKLTLLNLWYMGIPRNFEETDLQRLFGAMPALADLQLKYTGDDEPLGGYAQTIDAARAASEKEFVEKCVALLEHDAALCPQLQEITINDEVVKRCVLFTFKFFNG